MNADVKNGMVLLNGTLKPRKWRQIAKYHKRPACELTQAGRLRYSEKASAQRHSKLSECLEKTEKASAQLDSKLSECGIKNVNSDW